MRRTVADAGARWRPQSVSPCLYYVLDCEDIDAALEWAALIPSARYGAIEVRPLMGMPGHE
ncbi:MAG TPA: hypothetical protein VGI58_19650 [Streptosporangiaceae bacterium]|jgi:hypothetical protein